MVADFLLPLSLWWNFAQVWFTIGDTMEQSDYFFFFFFFFRKRKLGNTRVVHASLVSIIKNDGSLWRVEVFDLNNSVIQGRIYFHLNGGGNTFWIQRFENPEIFHGYWSVRDQLSLEKFLWWLKPRKKNYCRLLTWKFCWTLSP